MAWYNRFVRGISHNRSTRSCAASRIASVRSGSERPMRALACVLALLAVLGAAACAVPAEVGSDCVDELTCERARIDHLRSAGSSVGVTTSTVQPMPIDRV